MSEDLPPLFNEALLKRRRAQRNVANHYIAKEMQQVLSQRLKELPQLKANPSNEKEQHHFLTLGLTQSLHALFEQRQPQSHTHIPLENFCESTSLKSTYKPESPFDIICDIFLVHWLNDPVAYMRQVYESLAPGGFYFSAFPGGYSLKELRFALVDADLEVYGGACSRVSPMITPEAATRVLQATGFTDPVVDHELLTLEHTSLSAGICELRTFAETAAFADAATKPLKKQHIQILKDTLTDPKTGHVLSSLDIVYLKAHKKR